MNLSTRFKETATQFAGKDAYIFMDKATTYRELDAQVTRFAAGLQQLGLQKGDHIALLLGNSPHYIIALYGAFRAGITAIPINPIYTADEISYILNDGDVKLVVALDKVVPVIEKFADDVAVKQYIICETSPDTSWAKSKVAQAFIPFTHFMQQSHALQDVVVTGDDVALILYTSGTTGKPKGVMLTHDNLYANARDVGHYLGISGEDRVVTTLPMFHVFCLTVAMNAPLIQGGTLLIMPQFSPAEVTRVIKQYEATMFAGVPTMFNFLYQYPGATKEDMQSVRLWISGGSSLPVALLHDFEAKYDVKIREGYGLSEASPVTCFNPIDRPNKAGSIGLNIVNVTNRIVDPDGNDVPVGQVGELIVKGPNVMKGYYKMPEATAAALKDGWLHTGDLARQDEEGYFYIVDRKKEVIIVGGFNVYPREVEEVLYNHPLIAEAAAVGMPDPEQGEVVMSYIVKTDDALTEEEVLAYCREHLAKYKVPRRVVFLEELPKNTTGKILRRELQKLS